MRGRLKRGRILHEFSIVEPRHRKLVLLGSLRVASNDCLPLPDLDVSGNALRLAGHVWDVQVS